MVLKNSNKFKVWWLVWSLKIQQKQIQSPAHGKEESSAATQAGSSGVMDLEL